MNKANKQPPMHTLKPNINQPTQTQPPTSTQTQPQTHQAEIQEGRPFRKKLETRGKA